MNMKTAVTKKNLLVEITRDSVNSTIVNKLNDGNREDKDDAFYVVDLGHVVKQYMLWTTQLPRVEPFYAVKCNSDPHVLALLAELGAGFDCATKVEIQNIMDLNVSPDRIVYANPCKQRSHIRYAERNEVCLMTFDNEAELHKIKVNFPDAKLIIRIATDDSKSRLPLGAKYGCSLKTVPELLTVAAYLRLNVVGVSFHVGSDCYDGVAFEQAVAESRAAFDIAKSLGFHFDLLDIGGGFPGHQSAKAKFEEMAATLRVALEEHFPKNSGIRVIAEPGRFFVASALTLATNIIAKRSSLFGVNDEVLLGNDNPSSDCMYYINEGVYGSLAGVVFHHDQVKPGPLRDHKNAPTYTSSIWGPTCSSYDCIMKDVLLPKMDIGEWIIFKDMGAYSTSLASNFNGIPRPMCYYTMHHDIWEQFNSERKSNRTDERYTKNCYIT